MSGFSDELIGSSGYLREGFAAHYDRYRPRPPEALLDSLLQLARVERAALVVDLGAGTGLSTRAWAGCADRVVGVEPNPAMRVEAERLTEAANVELVGAFAYDTGLPGGTADVVTCSQSLHWMEPRPTFAEAARLLRPGGVFAAYDYDVIPVCDWEVEEAYAALLERRRALREELRIQRGADRYAKNGHLDRIRESGEFRYCREFLLQSVEEGGAERIEGFARSLGLPVADATLEERLRYDELREVAERVWGDRVVPFRFGYRVRVGIR
ncbi:MAG TPA: class I SAM-dependent methyltransferase [Gaiellaceae bacterium]|nr:class I SAM-dependent methyltransferase [Gaiellaceae bacterium]